MQAALEHTAGIVVVRMSRQAGKNEISARAEATLMARAMAATRRVGVKAAPTQVPQAMRSLVRLSAHLRACGFPRPFLTAGGDQVKLGASEWYFGSGEAEANVVGATADLLLEFDEAQDFSLEKHDKDYRPMAAATACATVYYGTAWTDFDLLETVRRSALEAEARDGRRRVFDVPWPRVAEEVPAYGLFVEAERARLGHTPSTPHVAFATQYELKTMAGAGRLFTPAQLALLQGEHPPQEGPASASHNVYVAGLDVGGANLAQAMSPDETVLTIARARFPSRGKVTEPIVEAVAQYAWAGLDHDQARAEMPRLLDHWRVGHTVVDATGIGEPLATSLLARYGERKVTALKFTAASKSSLGYDLLAAVNCGALRIWRPADNDAGHRALWAQARLARQELRLDGRLAWHVDQADGHDDRLISLALAVRAASRGAPRVATGRRFDQ